MQITMFVECLVSKSRITDQAVVSHLIKIFAAHVLFRHEADGTTPSIAVQKCIYNALLQDEPLGKFGVWWKVAAFCWGRECPGGLGFFQMEVG